MQNKALEKRARDFLHARKTLLMATSNEYGKPTISYAPFVSCNGKFYIYVSARSNRTNDLQRKSSVDVLLIEDEATAKSLFARIRIKFGCSAHAVSRRKKEWQEIIDLFGNKFGPVFDLVRPLADFTLFRLTPHEATYVEGFGKAYSMTGDLRNPTHVGGDRAGVKKFATKSGKKIYRIMRGDRQIIESAKKGIYAGWNGGQTKRRIFGRLDCKSGMRMKKENRVFFLTWDDAINAGFKPCKICKPTPSDA